MSAFMISTETMQRVVHAIDKQHYGTVWQNIVTTTSTGLDAVGQALFEMNAAALRARYPREDHFVPTFSYRPLGDVPAHDQFIAVECLLYQCAEGNVPETDGYKALERLRDGLAVSIAHSVARTAGAPWDWPER